MRNIVLSIIVTCLLLVSGSFAPIFNPGGSSGGVTTTITSGTALPGTCTAGQVFFDTDATSGQRFLYCDSTDTWLATLTSEIQTIQDVFNLNKAITGANSEANCFRVGTVTNYYCVYSDAGTGLYIKPEPLADTRVYGWTNKNIVLWDDEGAAAIETIDPDAASTLAMYTYGSNYRPKKSIWFGAGSLSTDGTQCAAPAEVTINSGPKIWTIICTENDAATMHGSVKMPDSWDAGTITLEVVYIQTAADTGTIKLDAGAQCRGTGEAVSTWGTEVDMDSTGTGSNKNDYATSAAITPTGTCAAGDMLYFRVQVDATSNPTTAAATLNFVGFKMEYSTTSRSD